MRWTCLISCALSFVIAATGCQSTERERLEEERRSLEFQRDNLRGTLNGSHVIEFSKRWSNARLTAYSQSEVPS